MRVAARGGSAALIRGSPTRRRDYQRVRRLDGGSADYQRSADSTAGPLTIRGSPTIRGSADSTAVVWLKACRKK
ncbi:hypothetical protein BV898_04570 [Hypsibius exemplaris]|uniref:Uncharacterized protein n=1 Tax=Hypsibius exemplaris TaxID=2072580 RepID=A0A1W0X1R9_HYPEX|nr:hypothetical protein BV898_04570 [Hypsibius exemplaris]